MKKTLLVFDIDGTLTDTANLHQKAFVQALKDLGVVQTPSQFNAFKHHTDSYIAKVIYEESGLGSFTAPIQQIFEVRLNNHLIKENIIEISGALSLMTTLSHQNEVHYSFATGSLLLPAKLKLNGIGLSYDSNLLAVSNTILDREGIVSDAIEKAKQVNNVSSYDRIISIGDGLWDLQTAQNLNLEFMGVGPVNKQVLLDYGMTVHHNDLTSINLNDL